MNGWCFEGSVGLGPSLEVRKPWLKANAGRLMRNAIAAVKGPGARGSVAKAQAQFLPKARPRKVLPPGKVLPQRKGPAHVAPGPLPAAPATWGQGPNKWSPPKAWNQGKSWWRSKPWKAWAWEEKQRPETSKELLDYAAGELWDLDP